MASQGSGKNTLNQLHEIIEIAETVVLDKKEQINHFMVCLLSQGHLLIEDQPGVGKTTLAQCMAQLLGLKSSRIQFTNDLIPSDIIGQSVFHRDKNDFFFKEGPLFSELILADELNRANPRTQSALLQAMEERDITVDRKTYHLPEVFFIVATQNPKNQIGTHPLPESQLDRFLMSIKLDFANREAEKAIILGENPRTKIKNLSAILNPDEILTIQKLVRKVYLSPEMTDTIVHLLEISRKHPGQFTPLSTRAGLALAQASKARAFLMGSDYVTPDHLRACIKPVFAHRLSLEQGLTEGDLKADELLSLVKIPS